MSIYSSLVKASNSGKKCAVCTIIGKTGTSPRKIGTKMIVYQSGEIEGSIGGGSVEKDVKQRAMDVIEKGKVEKIEFEIESKNKKNQDCIEVLIEPVIPDTTIVIFGAGHIGKNIAFFAKKLGWHVILVDDRFDLCNKNNIPDADDFISTITPEIEKRIFRKSNYYVFCTKSSDIDLLNLPKIIDIKPNYIGVLGSAKRWESTSSQLVEQGIKKEELEKIKAPIGIDIGAETPEEISISIIAQIIKANSHIN